MPPVEIEIGLSKHTVDMLEAFELRDRRIVLESIVLLDVDTPLSRHWQIFIPVDRHIVPTAIATIFTDIGQPTHTAITIGIDHDGGTITFRLTLLSLEYTVCYAIRVLEMVLSPEVGQGLMFPKRTMALHVMPIDGTLRTYLLIHRHTEQGGKAEVDGAEVARVDVIEVGFGPIVVEIAILIRIHVQVKPLQMVGDDGVDHAVFDKIEIIPITCRGVGQQLQHALLSQWGEQESKLLIAVAVARVECHLKVLIGHHGKVVMLQVSCLLAERTPCCLIG